MHSRHRGPNNGYRSNPREWGGAPSRIQQENSFRGGHGMYNPEYRNHNQGFGRGNPRPPGPPPAHISPPTPQRKPNIFAEAGRLATEYLVSRGVLPPNVFSGNFQNGSLKNLMGDFRGFRQQEKDGMSRHHSRRQSDEYNKPNGSKNQSRDKRRSKSNESDPGREIGKSSCSLSEKVNSNLVLEEKVVENEVIKVKSTSDVKSESQSAVDTLPNNDVVASNGKDLKVETEVEVPKTDGDVKSLDEKTDDPMDTSDSCQVEKQSGIVETAEDEPANHIDDNMSGSKDELGAIAVEEKDIDVSHGNSCNDEPLLGSEVIFKDVSVDNMSVAEIPNQVEGSKTADCDSVKETPEAGEIREMENDPGKYTRSQSLPLGSLMYENESNEGFLGIGRCSSMNLERGEKRAADYIDDIAVTKKPRAWVSTGVNQIDESLHLSHSTLTQDQPEVEKNGVDVIEYTEEMQLFPSSFKICDLNTVEASQRNEDPGQILFFPSITESSKEVDLSTCSNRDICGKYSTCGADGKEIEVIDLDDDCLQDDIFESAERKEGAVFTGSEGFPDHAQIVNDMSGVQDGYGLMMSDFLGNDIAGPGKVNHLQNDMALDNGAGILGDDESIYMSLEEIPISMPEI